MIKRFLLFFFFFFFFFFGGGGGGGCVCVFFLFFVVFVFVAGFYLLYCNFIRAAQIQVKFRDILN